ncbi:MAG: N-acetylmuramic acid 6-phosphate etherase, partial [Candidatus Latescibacterota bacterium]|jgi:N-acetylmuramic acid 6-phosphate etherase
VADAVGGSVPDIARVVDLVVGSFRRGGRLLYFGAGTSGRLGVIDAAECPPTFGVDPGMVVGVIAGGKETVFLSREGIEDDRAGGERDVEANNVTDRDTVVGIAASRRTPYVLGALAAARRRGASTAFLRCNDGQKPEVDVVVTVIPGPEAITGSTRMKAGTAQKMVLNMITTASMVKLGKVYENLMVDLQPNSEKLVERGKGIVMALAGLTYAEAESVYDASGKNVKVAVVMARKGMDRRSAERALDAAGGFLARALEERR